MSVKARYIEFTTVAYEDARRTGDWTHVYDLLADDAVFLLPLAHHGGGSYHGRGAFVLHHRARQTVLNRCFRDAELTAFTLPVFSGDTVSQVLSAGWRAPGLPDLTAEFELRIAFKDDLIASVEEVWAPGATSRVHEHLSEHGSRLGFRPEILDLVPSADLQLVRRGMQLVDRHLEVGAEPSPASPVCTTPIPMHCRSTFQAPGIPDLHLEYALDYRFVEPQRIDVDERWTPAMRDRLRVHLEKHGAKIRQRGE